MHWSNVWYGFEGTLEETYSFLLQPSLYPIASQHPLQKESRQHRLRRDCVFKAAAQLNFDTWGMIQHWIFHDSQPVDWTYVKIRMCGKDYDLCEVLILAVGPKSFSKEDPLYIPLHSYSSFHLHDYLMLSVYCPLFISRVSRPKAHPRHRNVIYDSPQYHQLWSGCIDSSNSQALRFCEPWLSLFQKYRGTIKLLL